MEAPVAIENKPIVSRYEKIAKIISLVIFPLVFVALLGAIIGDIAVFAMNIIYFFIACLAAVGVFIIGFFLMLISIVLIFGVYLLEEYGFWPAQWAAKGFSEVMADNKVAPGQVMVLVIIRIVLIVLCVLILASAIVALVFAKKAQKRESRKKTKKNKSLQYCGYNPFSFRFICRSSFNSLTSVVVLT